MLVHQRVNGFFGVICSTDIQKKVAQYGSIWSPNLFKNNINISTKMERSQKPDPHMISSILAAYTIYYHPQIHMVAPHRLAHPAPLAHSQPLGTPAIPRRNCGGSAWLTLEPISKYGSWLATFGNLKWFSCEPINLIFKIHIIHHWAKCTV